MKRIKGVGLILLFIVGLSILLYPTISNKWNEYRAQQLISTYENTVTNNVDEAKVEEQLQMAKTYNDSLVGCAVPDAFSVRDGVEDQTYEDTLNVDGNGMMGYIEIPTIDVTIPIYHYTTEASLQKGVGHLFGSSLPVGGNGTHAVLSAHRGLPSSKLFTDLDQLIEGDVFYIHVFSETLAYQVDQILVVTPDETESLGLDRDNDYVTLVTCTPYAVNTHRLLVRGHRIPFEETAYEEEISNMKSPKPTQNYMMMQILCVVIGIVLALIIVKVVGRRQNRKGQKHEEQ